jgi:hypothetical protein
MYDATAEKPPIRSDVKAPEPPSALMVQFLTWIAEPIRTYDEAMEAWRSTCPRHTIWEDALEEKWIEVRTEESVARVMLTDSGRAVLGACSTADQPSVHSDTSAREPRSSSGR